MDQISLQQCCCLQVQVTTKSKSKLVKIIKNYTWYFNITTMLRPDAVRKFLKLLLYK